MLDRMDTLIPIDDLSLARELKPVGRDDRGLRRAAARGELIRLSRGVYTDAKDWDLRDATLQYQLRCLGAATGSRTSPILSHASAAALLRVPRWGAQPRTVHVLASHAAGSRTESPFTRHATKYLDLEIDSLGEARRTSLRRTLVEYCATEPFPNSVVALDWAVAGEGSREAFSKANLLQCAEELELTRGRTRFHRALAFADGLSGSPGESYSRAVIHELGFPAPELQADFRDSRGFVGRVDFWWEEHGLIGEFDGIAKYTRQEFTQGVSAAEIVLSEKRRENRLRALGPTVARWDAEVLARPRRLYRLLIEAGLRSRRRPRFD